AGLAAHNDARFQGRRRRHHRKLDRGGPRSSSRRRAPGASARPGRRPRPPLSRLWPRFMTALASKQWLRRPVTSYALRLRGIRVQGHMGVSDVERSKPQELVVAVDLELDGSRYPATDDLDRAANYAEVVRVATESADAVAD